MKTIKQTILEEFRLHWGLAPEDSLKGRKGKDLERFLSQALDRLEAEVRKETIEEVQEIIKKAHAKQYPFDDLDIAAKELQGELDKLKQSKE